MLSKFQWNALAWGDLEPSYASVNFFLLANSVSWWQRAFEWGSVLTLKLLFLEKLLFRQLRRYLFYPRNNAWHDFTGLQFFILNKNTFFFIKWHKNGEKGKKIYQKLKGLWMKRTEKSPKRFDTSGVLSECMWTCSKYGPTIGILFRLRKTSVNVEVYQLSFHVFSFCASHPETSSYCW